MAVEHSGDSSPNGGCQQQHCTLAVIRALTRPLIHPPKMDELKDVLLSPWNVRIPVDPSDYTTRSHWKEQKHTQLFQTMMDWEPSTKSSVASLHPYFSFGSTSSPFFEPWADVGHCLLQLLLHQIASHQTASYITLTSHETHLFLATAPNYCAEMELENLRLHTTNVVVQTEQSYYLLRCHYDKTHKKLLFGYHTHPTDKEQFQVFHHLLEISLLDDDWRLNACIVLKNLARILHCLKDYTVPLIWSNSTKLSLVSNDDTFTTGCIQKIYNGDKICDTFGATVQTMIEIYQALEQAKVPHTDRLVSVEQRQQQQDITTTTICCKFAPIGRSYLPENLKELLQALICVAEALVAMHAIGIMHRDIRWANVFHAFASDNLSSEWVLFDFEFAARAPKPAFGAHTLTPGNHAPEMVDTDDEIHSEYHDTAVDIWGLGYLLQHAAVDIPVSHNKDLQSLQTECLEKDPRKRPTAQQCLERLRALQARPPSTEKTVQDLI